MFKGVLPIWENHNIPAITGCQHYTYDIQYLQQNDEYLQDLLSNKRKYSFLGALVVTSEEKKRTNRCRYYSCSLRFFGGYTVWKYLKLL